MRKTSPCPNCGHEKQYRSRAVSAGGGYAPNYLPGLGSFLRAGKFFLVACASCGLVRFFASPEAIEKLPTSAAWERI